MDQKSFIASPASGSESWGGGRDPSDSPRKSTWPPPRIGCSRIKVDVLSSWCPPERLLRPSAAGKIKFPFFGKYYFLWFESFRVDFWCVHRFQLSMSETNMSPFQILTAYRAYPRNNPGKTFFPQLMDSWLVLRRNRVILNQWTKRNDRSFEEFSKTPFEWSLPIRQEILNVSQIGKAFHGICPPFFIQTWLQQYCRRTFFHSAHCSFSNPICFRSVWCRLTMIPGKIFTSFAKLQGIVCVIDFRLPVRLQALLQAPLCFLRSFCFARIRLDPLGGQVLHHDCISMFVSRLTTFTENIVTCCNQITKIFCTWYGSANASSARFSCSFGPQTDLAISLFREVSINTVSTQIHTSRWRRL